MDPSRKLPEVRLRWWMLLVVCAPAALGAWRANAIHDAQMRVLSQKSEVVELSETTELEWRGDFEGWPRGDELLVRFWVSTDEIPTELEILVETAPTLEFEQAPIEVEAEVQGRRSFGITRVTPGRIDDLRFRATWQPGLPSGVRGWFAVRAPHQDYLVGMMLDRDLTVLSMRFLILVAIVTYIVFQMAFGWRRTRVVRFLVSRQRPSVAHSRTSDRLKRSSSSVCPDLPLTVRLPRFGGRPWNALPHPPKNDLLCARVGENRTT